MKNSPEIKNKQEKFLSNKIFTKPGTLKAVGPVQLLHVILNSTRIVGEWKGREVMSAG